MRFGKRSMLSAAMLILPVLIGACSSKQFLIVHYQLPPPSEALVGKEASLVVLDVRENKGFLSENARKSLRDFNETYSLVVLNADGSGNLVGLFEVGDLISKLFQRKFDNLGLQLPPPGTETEYELEIKLNEFKLDLVGRKWIVNMNYQANLLKNKRLVAMESISGSAERLKVMGKSDAEKIMGELLTDMVNKLDLAKLFQQAQR